MSKAFKAAKEKYDAVINDAGRGDYVCRTNRIGATRHPSSGDCSAVNMVHHPQQRRRSSGAMSDRVKNWINRPAY